MTWVEVDGAGWNGYSWLLSPVASRRTVLAVGSVCYTVAGVGFVAGGVGYALALGWVTPVLVGAALLSAVLIVALWDGERDALVDKGALGVVLDAGIVAALLLA